MFEIEIKKGAVSKEHVHLFVSAPPNLAPSEIMRRLNDLHLKDGGLVLCDFHIYSPF